MDQKSATFSSRPRAFASWSIRKARSLLAAQSSITARTCKKAGSKSQTRTPSPTVRAAKAFRCDVRLLNLPSAYGVGCGVEGCGVVGCGVVFPVAFAFAVVFAFVVFFLASA